MPHFCYLNGDVLPVADAHLGVTDIGLLRGYGLFDYCRTYHGRPFMRHLYLDRLANSAREMQLEVPISPNEIMEVMDDLRRRSQMHDLAFRFVLTGGYTADGITPGQPNFLIMTENLPEVSSEKLEHGIKVIPCEHLREMPEVKSTNYMRLILMAKEMKAQGAADVLYHLNGEISELSRSNFFIFQGDTLVTPHHNILKGITRRVVIDLAAQHFRIEQRAVSLEEVYSATEAFTTGTTKKVMPVHTVGDKPIANGRAGERTKFLQDLFDKFTEM